MKRDWRDNPHGIHQRTIEKAERERETQQEWREGQCGAVNVWTGRNCTKPKGHGGPHA